MVDDWIMVRSVKRTRQLDTPSGGGGAGWFGNMDPEARGFVENCGWDGVVGEFEGILEGVV